MEDGGFQLVTKGHRLCSRKRNPCPNRSGRKPMEPSFKSSKEIYDRLVELKSQDIIRKYSSDLEDLLRASVSVSFTDIICYGIGCIAEDTTSQYQLVVLLALVERLKVKRVAVYDPVLSVEELSALERLGMETIKTNEVCRCPVSSPTLFYMIHCGVAMYNNLLYSNWSINQLTNITIVGNCFSNYYLRLTEKQLKEASYYLSKIKGGFREVGLPTFAVPNVFNDTAAHSFPLDKLQYINQHVWRDKPEPQLDSNDEEVRIH